MDEQIYEKIFVGNVQTPSKSEVDEFIASLPRLNESELKKVLISFAQQ